jgi:hypothetical protein
MGAVTIPILPSPDFDTTSSYYAALGFRECGRWGDYLILDRDDQIELHFWLSGDVDPLTNDVACYIRFDTAAEAQALYDEWSRVQLAGGRLNSPKATDYGLLEFALIDAHGNLVRVGGTLEQ